LFLYDDDRGTRIAMLMRPMTVDRTAPMTRHSYGPIEGYAWANKGVGYTLVAAASPDVLHPLANEVRRQIDAVD
jgi:anti-sigma factor RsiW